VIVNNSTNINKTNYHHLPSLTEHKKTMTYGIEIQSLACDRHKNVADLNKLMGSQPPLDNWMSKANTDINKQENLLGFLGNRNKNSNDFDMQNVLCQLLCSSHINSNYIERLCLFPGNWN
jgi:hypothetical protein